MIMFPKIQYMDTVDKYKNMTVTQLKQEIKYVDRACARDSKDEKKKIG